MFFGRTQLRRAEKLLSQGELEAAATLALQNRLAEKSFARVFCTDLTQVLFQQARQQAAVREFSGAWQSLNLASRLGNHFDARRVVQARQSLLEETLHAAECWLQDENLSAAQAALEHLSRQHILDCRADRIHWTIAKVRESEAKADAGQWKQAVIALDEAVSRHPELAWLSARATRLKDKMQRATDLANRLQNALLGSHWNDVRQVSCELLGISPHYPIAADALRRCQQADSRPAKPSRQAAAVPVPENAVAAEALNRGPGNPSRAESPPGPVAARRFLWWVDGVGGYLACTGGEWLLGRAVPDAAIEIPIQGDLSRRHAKITRSGSDYLLTPFAVTRLDGRIIDRPTLLRHGQVIQLGDHVRICFLLPHPYSASAKLEVLSRHRTLPWADAILLVADTVLIGARANSHIVSPSLDQPLVMTFDSIGWRCRQGGSALVAGQAWPAGHPLPTDSVVIVEGLSMSLETIGKEKSYA